MRLPLLRVPRARWVGSEGASAEQQQTAEKVSISPNPSGHVAPSLAQLRFIW